MWVMRNYNLTEKLESTEELDMRRDLKQSSSYLSGKLLSLEKNESSIRKISGIDLSSKVKVKLGHSFQRF
jgi:hypothetical protein